MAKKIRLSQYINPKTNKPRLLEKGLGEAWDWSYACEHEEGRDGALARLHQAACNVVGAEVAGGDWYGDFFKADLPDEIAGEIRTRASTIYNTSFELRDLIGRYILHINGGLSAIEKRKKDAEIAEKEIQAQQEMICAERRKITEEEMAQANAFAQKRLKHLRVFGGKVVFDVEVGGDKKQWCTEYYMMPEDFESAKSSDTLEGFFEIFRPPFVDKVVAVQLVDASGAVIA